LIFGPQADQTLPVCSSAAKELSMESYGRFFSFLFPAEKKIPWEGEFSLSPPVTAPIFPKAHQGLQLIRLLAAGKKTDSRR